VYALQRKRSSWSDLIARQPLFSLLTYYALLLIVSLGGWRILPSGIRAYLDGPVTELLGTDPRSLEAASAVLQGTALPPDSPASPVAAALAILAAFSLALPVAWLYTQTRQKRGFRQSVVHTLIILPVVVSGVVVLVKHSLALAFSLAGIVAAVRFRNTLEDSKDAVYIFVATGIGLAAGVQVGVAMVISLLFNFVVLYLWYTDFGRSPSNLEGHDAARRMQRALAIANRTGAFVARLDQEILKEMSPEQLEALADRARRRRERLDSTLPDAEDSEERPEATRAIRMRAVEPDGARRLMEESMGDMIKRANLSAVEQESDGSWRIEYAVTLRKSATTQGMLAALRSRGAGVILDAEKASSATMDTGQVETGKVQ
jgi:hypothetical protein